MSFVRCRRFNPCHSDHVKRSRFSNYFIEKQLRFTLFLLAVLTYENLPYRGISLKESKIKEKIFIKVSILDTGFLTKSVSFFAHIVPQIELVTYMPASDGAVAHYRIAHIRLRSSESPLQRNSPFGTPLPA